MPSCSWPWDVVCTEPEELQPPPARWGPERPGLGLSSGPTAAVGRGALRRVRCLSGSSCLPAEPPLPGSGCLPTNTNPLHRNTNPLHRQLWCKLNSLMCVQNVGKNTGICGHLHGCEAGAGQKFSRKYPPQKWENLEASISVLRNSWFLSVCSFFFSGALSSSMCPVNTNLRHDLQLGALSLSLPGWMLTFLIFL